MKRIVVCDDDIESTAYLRNLLDEYFSYRKVKCEVAYYKSGEELILNENSNIDVAILDVEMDKLNGIQTGYEILKRYPETTIMITTAFMHYLDDAMDLKVFRYLEKPVGKERLFRALDICLKEKKTFLISTSQEVKLIREDEIVCIFVKFRKTAIFLNNGETVTANVLLKEWCQMLNSNNSFGMPHSSFLVNFNYVRSLGSDYVIVESKTGKQMKIYASKRKYPEFKRKFNEKMREFI